MTFGQSGGAVTFGQSEGAGERGDVENIKRRFGRPGRFFLWGMDPVGSPNSGEPTGWATGWAAFAVDSPELGESTAHI